MTPPPSDPQLSLVVPSYRRPDALAENLAATLRQDPPIAEVIVVVRSGDQPSLDCAARFPTVRVVTIDAPGVLAAMQAGARTARFPLIGFMDDDAAPHAGWHAAVLRHFTDSSIGGVCGRDLVASPTQPRADTSVVGHVTSWGRLIGNHHLGIGPARPVTVLKAANVVFRREALALPVDLRGGGAQAHFEVATSLWARERGWALWYDPDAQVDHTPAERFDADRRGAPAAQAVEDAAYNLVFGMLSERPRLTLRRTLYGLLVGDGGTPGLASAASTLARGDRALLARVRPSLRGQVAATRDIVRGRRVAMYTFGPPGSGNPDSGR